MATSKRPRKQYKPLVQRLAMQAARAHQMTDADADIFRLAVLGAFDGISKGTGTASEWNTLASALNHSFTLANKGAGEEILPTLTKANNGMMRARDRYTRTGRLGFDGEAMADIKLALDLWFEQLMLCTVGEVDSATKQVRKHTERIAA